MVRNSSTLKRSQNYSRNQVRKKLPSLLLALRRWNKRKLRWKQLRSLSIRVKKSRSFQNSTQRQMKPKSKKRPLRIKTKSKKQLRLKTTPKAKRKMVMTKKKYITTSMFLSCSQKHQYREVSLVSVLELRLKRNQRKNNQRNNKKRKKQKLNRNKQRKLRFPIEMFKTNHQS